MALVWIKVTSSPLHSPLRNSRFHWGGVAVHRWPGHSLPQHPGGFIQRGWAMIRTCTLLCFPLQIPKLKPTEHSWEGIWILAANQQARMCPTCVWSFWAASLYSERQFPSCTCCFQSANNVVCVPSLRPEGWRSLPSRRPDRRQAERLEGQVSLPDRETELCSPRCFHLLPNHDTHPLTLIPLLLLHPLPHLGSICFHSCGGKVTSDSLILSFCQFFLFSSLKQQLKEKNNQ